MVATIVVLTHADHHIVVLGIMVAVSVSLGSIPLGDLTEGEQLATASESTDLLGSSVDYVEHLLYGEGLAFHHVAIIAPPGRRGNE